MSLCHHGSPRGHLTSFQVRLRSSGSTRVLLGTPVWGQEEWWHLRLRTLGQLPQGQSPPCPQPQGTSEADGQQDTGTEAGGPGNVHGDHVAPQHGHRALAPGTELSPGAATNRATPEMLSLLMAAGLSPGGATSGPPLRCCHQVCLQ